MSRTTDMTDKAETNRADAKGVDAKKVDPWRVPIAVAQLPETGLHRDIEAGPAERAAIAEIGGLREVLAVSASLDITPQSGGRFHVEGRVRARIPDSWRNYELKLFEFEFTFAAPGSLRRGRKLRRLVDERMKAWG